MITPADIKKQCLRWWKEVLLSAMEGTDYFPKEIDRIKRITAKDILSRLSEHKQSILEIQKQALLWGYEVCMAEQTFDKIGTQLVPVKIEIPSLAAYLRITARKTDFDRFRKNWSLVNEELPRLRDWCKANLQKLVEHTTWRDTLKVCHYFLANPKPGLYLRELPIDIHTKYIEENKELIQSLLDFLIPESVNWEEKVFEKRYHLRFSEPLIRIRFLDTSQSLLEGVDDLSVPLSTFRTLRCHCRNIVMAENKMNFLTLPPQPHTLALWSGGGFNIRSLKNTEWLMDKHIYYWGDLDAQGFQILNQFRSYYPHTIALMMDALTWDRFSSLAKEGTPAVLQSLSCLTPEEYDLYTRLQAGNLRLEQEKIPQSFSNEQIGIHILR